MDKLLHIRSPKFPVLPGEEEELVNEGLYGKSLALYLQEKLKHRGRDTPFVCCEDWGWWVELRDVPFDFGVCVRRFRDDEFVCCAGVTSPRKWSWRRFRFVSTEPYTVQLLKELQSIFEADEDVKLLGVVDDMPDDGDYTQFGIE